MTNLNYLELDDVKITARAHIDYIVATLIKPGSYLKRVVVEHDDLDKYFQDYKLLNSIHYTLEGYVKENQINSDYSEFITNLSEGALGEIIKSYLKITELDKTIHDYKRQLAENKQQIKTLKNMSIQ